MAEVNDEALLHGVTRRDEAALGILYDRYARMAYSLAFRVVGDEATAQDVVQEAYLKIWRMAHTYTSSRGSVKSWMLAVVHHQAVDVCRGRRATVPIDPPLDAESGPSFELIAPENVWEAVTAKLDKDALAKALDLIPIEQRRLIELAFFKGYTHREIAELARLPLGTVKGRIRIGMEKLRDLLLKERVEP